jgi:hypothetical protein
MKTNWWLSFALVPALVIIPAAQAAPRTAVPGTVNYIEGQVSIDGNPMPTQQDGTAALSANQTLSVGTGKAEVLLSPGTFVRVGNNSEIRMVSPTLANGSFEVVRGEAMVEVDYKPKLARLDVMERGADTSLLKEGLYKFDADEGRVEVIDGKVAVNDNGQNKEIGKGKEFVLTGAAFKPVSFDRKSEDDLYRWSDVRASYLAEANEASARTVYVDGGWGWGPGWGMGWGPGWFWNPYFATYSWLPGDGYFWSPFGYPFFSPGYVRYAPTIRAYYPSGAHAAVPAGRGTLGARAGAVPSAGFRSMAGAAHFSGGGMRGGGGRR